MGYKNSPSARGEGESVRSLLFVRFKVFFAYEADGAGPVIRELLKGGTGGDVVLRVPYVWVIHPVTYGAFILLHDGVGL